MTFASNNFHSRLLPKEVVEQLGQLRAAIVAAFRRSDDAALARACQMAEALLRKHLGEYQRRTNALVRDGTRERQVEISRRGARNRWAKFYATRKVSVSQRRKLCR